MGAIAVGFRGSMFRCEYSPFAGDTLKGSGAAVAEAQARAGHQILYCARHKDLAGAGERGNARADVDSDPADVLSHHLALAGMQPGAHFDIECLDFLGDGAGAANAARGPVKRGEKTIARRLDLTAAKTREIASDVA